MYFPLISLLQHIFHKSTHFLGVCRARFRNIHTHMANKYAHMQKKKLGQNVYYLFFYSICRVSYIQYTYKYIFKSARVQQIILLCTPAARKFKICSMTLNVIAICKCFLIFFFPRSYHARATNIPTYLSTYVYEKQRVPDLTLVCVCLFAIINNNISVRGNCVKYLTCVCVYKSNCYFEWINPKKNRHTLDVDLCERARFVYV